MISPQPTPASTDPNHADALRWAERRLAMLQQLSALGMRLADEVVERAVNSPYHPEARHEAGRAFASVSRAVRLTLVLEARAEAEFFAVRGGEMPKQAPAATLRARGSAPAGGGGDVDVEDADVARAEADVRERTYECLVDREVHEALLDLPFDDCVEGIRADLRSAVVGTATAAEQAADGTSVLGGDDLETCLPFMGRVDSQRERGGEVSHNPLSMSTPLTSPPRSASPSRPSP